MGDRGVANIGLAESRAPENHPETECPLCQAGKPMSTF
jgi:hypothetical protein